MRTRVIELRIKKESKESLTGGRDLNATERKKRRIEDNTGKEKGSEEKRGKSRRKEEERMKAKSSVPPKKSGTE